MFWCLASIESFLNFSDAISGEQVIYDMDKQSNIYKTRLHSARKHKRSGGDERAAKMVKQGTRARNF